MFLHSISFFQTILQTTIHCQKIQKAFFAKNLNFSSENDLQARFYRNPLLKTKSPLKLCQIDVGGWSFFESSMPVGKCHHHNIRFSKLLLHSVITSCYARFHHSHGASSVGRVDSMRAVREFERSSGINKIGRVNVLFVINHRMRWEIWGEATKINTESIFVRLFAEIRRARRVKATLRLWR